jgi:hypothetical protein
MRSFTGQRPSLASATLLAACLTAGLLAGCSTNSKNESSKDLSEGLIGYLADRPFSEGETTMPALPADADLIPFSVTGTGSFIFAVDSKSISVGKDNVVRYTVVVRSRSGARNVNFEGMRCDSFENKLYATLPQGATAWQPNLAEGGPQWRRMDSISNNNYASALATDYFCDGHTVAGPAPTIVRALRDQSPTRLYR